MPHAPREDSEEDVTMSSNGYAGTRYNGNRYSAPAPLDIPSTEPSLGSMDTQTLPGHADRRDGWRARYLWDRLYPDINDFSIALRNR